MNSGEVRCWGDNRWGQLGDGTTTDSSVPVTVLESSGPSALSGVAQVSAGWSTTCVRMVDGTARCWGAGANGALGNGTRVRSTRPAIVLNGSGTGPLERVTDIAAAGGHTCASRTNGEVRCWGSNHYFQLGDGTRTRRLLPALVSAVRGPGWLRSVVAVSARNISTCALLAGGQARCWGANDRGQLGDGTGLDRPRPVAVRRPRNVPGPLTDVAEIVIGSVTGCARLDGGQVRCWGGDFQGTLGDGSANQSTSSRAVVVRADSGPGPLVGVARVDRGGDHTCTRQVSGQARCWGPNYFGALGDGSTTNRGRPVVVLDASGTEPLADLRDVDAGDGFTCAVTNVDTLWCWGRNDQGQLGDGTTNDRPLPGAVVVP